MINIKDLEKNKSFYISNFKNKGFFLEKKVNDVLKLNKNLLNLIKEEQSIRLELKKTSNLIKNNFNDSKLKENAKKLSYLAKKNKEEINLTKININKILINFPNISNDDVPIGKSEKNNVVISTHLDEIKENKNSKPHWEIIEHKKLILSNESSYISGKRHVIYSENAAKVINALEAFMLNNAQKFGFKIIEPPVIVNKEALFNTGQIPKFEEDLYKISENQYLIPTAEVPLTNLVANKIINENELPKKFVSSTSCFRKEAGSAGRDTRGLIRLHQFRKVELVTIGKPENEENDFKLILNAARNILDELKIPYRLVNLCTGDLSFTSKKTIDIEVWMPGTKTYKEISSVSIIGDFQSRRMKSRYKDLKGNKKLVHTYNGSALAIERTFAAIIENYFQKDGTILVPNALKKYLPFSSF